MKRFIKKAAIFSIIIILSLIIFPTILPKNETNIMHSIEDKHFRLLSSSRSKLVFIGGSNLLYGLDSERVQVEYKEYEVVNMGLHAGLGMRYMLDDLYEYLREGDIVVLSMEYEQFYGTMNGEAALGILLKEEPKEWSNITARQLKEYIKNYPIFIRGQIAGCMKSIINGVEDPIQNRKYVNKYGDLIGHLDKESPENIGGIYLKDFDEASIEYLNNYYNKATEKDVKVYLSWPSLYIREYDKNIGKIEELENALKIGCKIPIISEVNNYLFNKDEMFDTAYHLSIEGRETTTDILINDLSTIISKGN